MELAAKTRLWIESTIGGEIVSVVRQGRWRIQYFVDVRRPDGNLVPLLVRCSRSGAETENSCFLSNFNIVHEAAILSVLQGKGLAIPIYYGFNPDDHSILMERVDGSPDLTKSTDADRFAVMRSYIENIAHLHALDIKPSELPPSAIPNDDREKALGKMLVLMERTYAGVRIVSGPNRCWISRSDGSTKMSPKMARCALHRVIPDPANSWQIKVALQPLLIES
jgi:hypothetical protein